MKISMFTFWYEIKPDLDARQSRHHTTCTPLDSMYTTQPFNYKENVKKLLQKLYFKVYTVRISVIWNV